MKTGVTQPKLVVNNVIAQLDAMIAMGVDKSPFYQPIAKMPAGFSASDKARLTAAYRDRIAKIVAVYTRMRDFLKNEYLPAARDARRPVGDAGRRRAVRLHGGIADHDAHDAARKSTISACPRWRASRPEWRRSASRSGSPATCTRSSNICAPIRNSSRHRRKICTSAMSRSCSGVRRRSRATFRWCRRRRWKSARVPDVPRKEPGGRILQPRYARRLAARHLLLQHLRPAFAPHLGRRNAVPARGHSGPSFPDRADAGKRQAAELHAVRRQHRLRRRLGALCRNCSGPSSACTPTRIRCSGT